MGEVIKYAHRQGPVLANPLSLLVQLATLFQLGQLVCLMLLGFDLIEILFEFGGVGEVEALEVIDGVAQVVSVFHLDILADIVVFVFFSQFNLVFFTLFILIE